MVSLLLAIIYVAFISLGLPDALLGAAWPAMYPELKVPVSYAGILSMIIALGTILSSLQSDRMTKRFGTGKVTAVSVGLTAAALLGFSVSHSFPLLCLFAIPYGLGAGSVDASLNNYVALHYESRHMSWLHCFWGLGASVGPYIMSFALTGSWGWNGGYRIIALLQIALTLVLFSTLRLWKASADAADGEKPKALSLKQILAIPGAKEVMLCFFCYCGLEQTAMLWAGSYLTLFRGMEPETAARFASFCVIGITLGRLASGFLTLRFSDKEMIRIGFGFIGLGIGVMLSPLGTSGSLAGLMLVGLGCAPIYPSIIHSTPAHFGADKSQAVIGVQMASAYVGTLLMPPLFGLVAEHIAVSLLPLYLAALLVLMAVMHGQLCKKSRSSSPSVQR